MLGSLILIRNQVRRSCFQDDESTQVLFGPEVYQGFGPRLITWAERKSLKGSSRYQESRIKSQESRVKSGILGHSGKDSIGAIAPGFQLIHLRRPMHQKKIKSCPTSECVTSQQLYQLFPIPSEGIWLTSAGLLYLQKLSNLLTLQQNEFFS